MSRRWIAVAVLLGAAGLARAGGAGHKTPSRPPAQTGAAKRQPPDAGFGRFDPKNFEPQYKPFQWDAPKVLSEIDVPAQFDTNGIPSRFHVALLGVPGDEAYAFFLKSFTEQGLWVDPPEKQLQLGEGQLALTGFEPNTETSYTVILQPYPSGHTGVIMGEAYWKDRTFAPGSTFAPVMAGAEGLLTQNLESGLAMSYRVQAAPEAIEQFYEGELLQAGFSKASSGTYLKGTEVVQVAISPGEDGWAGVALVQLSVPEPSPQAPWKADDSD